MNDLNDCNERIYIYEHKHPMWSVAECPPEESTLDEESGTDKRKMCPDCFESHSNLCAVQSCRGCHRIGNYCRQVDLDSHLRHHSNLPEICRAISEQNFKSDSRMFRLLSNFESKEVVSDNFMKSLNLKTKLKLKRSITSLRNATSEKDDSNPSMEMTHFRSDSSLLNTSVNANQPPCQNVGPLTDRRVSYNGETFKFTMRYLILVGTFVAGSTLAPLLLICYAIYSNEGMHQSVGSLRDTSLKDIDNSSIDEREGTSYYYITEETDGLYNESRGSQSSYAVLHTPSSFDEAQTRCQKQGGHLAHINSLREQLLVEQVLLHFLSKNSGTLNSGGFWIGARKPGWLRGLNHCVPDQWKWVDANNFYKSTIDGQTAFVPGKPDYEEGEECLFLTETEGLIANRYLKWDDISCDPIQNSILGFCEISDFKT